jgi:glycosyltransferase involved in cell wall biosynthesis
VNRLSVVLITKDQAWNVDRLVGSVLRELAHGPPAEVLLVDSASEDGTAERAAHHPIGVLRLAPDQRLTPALGRYVGGRETHGELVLFLDGDMELCPEWLERAVQVMAERPDVGVVTGTVVDRPSGAARSPAGVPEEVASPFARASEPRIVPYTAGAALHRRSVLDAVGSFHPYLRSDEEPELCIRVRHAGHQVVDLARPVALHYSEPSRSVSTVLARRRRGLFLGAGQAIRVHLGSELLWPYVRERGYGLVPGLALLGAAAAVVAGVAAGRWRPLGAWSAAMGMTVTAEAVRRRSARDTAFSVVQRVCILEGTVRGFLARPAEPESHPALFDVVRPLASAVVPEAVAAP